MLKPTAENKIGNMYNLLMKNYLDTGSTPVRSTKSYNMNKTVEKINKYFRDNYDIKVDYSTMTITLKKKNNESKKCTISTNSRSTGN